MARPPESCGATVKQRKLAVRAERNPVVAPEKACGATVKQHETADPTESVTETPESLTYPISEVRAAWLLGAMAGGCVYAAWLSHSWEPLPMLVIGAYGLFDNRKANAKLRRRE